MSLTNEQKARVGMWLRTARCYNLAMKALRATLRDECTMPQFDILAQIARHEDGLTFSELSRLLLVTAGNLTGIVDRLEKQQFVYRQTNPKDRRQTFIKLTEQGRVYCDEIIPQHERDIAELFGGLSDQTVMSLREGLGAMAELLRARVDQMANGEEGPGGA